MTDKATTIVMTDESTTTSIKNNNNADMRPDATETSLGICAYRSPDVPGFSGVLKGRFSDFLVHEVSLDGAKAELTSLDTTISTAKNGEVKNEQDEGKPSSDRKRKRDDGVDNKEDNATINNDNNSALTAVHDDAKWAPDATKKAEEVAEETSTTTAVPTPLIEWEKLQSELEDLLKQEEDGNGNTKQCATQVIEFLQKHPCEEQKYVGIPMTFCNHKQHRRALHQWIRARLANLALADTTDDEHGVKIIRVWNPKFVKEMPNYGKFDNNNNNPSRQKNRGPLPGKFLRFVVYKENLDTNSALQQIQRRGGGGGVGGGGSRGKRLHHALKLGFAGMKDKRGITAQFVTMPARASVESLMRAVNPKDKTGDAPVAGGGHTDAAGVSVLRIGNFMYVNDDLRLGRLQGNRFDVVLRNIAMPNSKDRNYTKTVLAQAVQALGTMGFINYFGVQRFGKYCDTHLVGIAILQKNFAKAVDIILRPKPDERENTRLARKAWQERFSKIADDAPQSSREAAESECAKRVVKDFGRFIHNEIALLKSLMQRPLDYRRAINCVTKTMRMMFVHALQSLLFNHAATFRLQSLGDQVIEGDLVLEGPIDISNMGIPKVRKVTAKDVEEKRYTLEDVFLPLIGSKTIDPDDETTKIIVKILEQNGLTRDSFDIKDRDFNCAGDYRKVIVRPTDVDYETIEYTDPRQPLVQTDLMKLQGIPIKTAPPDKADDSLLGMRVGFTLPSSSYATIALRELMKRPTSTDYQKDLSLDS